MRRVLLIVMGLDVLLAVSKGSYGYLTGSLGMLSDGFHSVLHALGGVISLIGVNLAARPPDDRHPYGYERYEPLAAMGVSALMFIAVWKILSGAWFRLHSSGIPVVTDVSFIIMSGAVIAGIGLATWERHMSRKLSSSMLEADSGRVWGDTFVSISVIAGLVAASAGLPWLDAVVAIIVAVFIAWTAWGTIHGASRVLSDAVVADLDSIARAASSVEGVQGCHRVRARGVSGMVRVDLHILVDPKMTVEESHRLVDEVERRIRTRVGGITEVLVHVGEAMLHNQ
ncbi:MAG: cation diffusion facilitator family transporter [Nitrospiraceae bacterium]|nr:cation diffusion facilitator family transporter [Nitrospiraceae bacterium]